MAFVGWHPPDSKEAGLAGNQDFLHMTSRDQEMDQEIQTPAPTEQEPVSSENASEVSSPQPQAQQRSAAKILSFQDWLAVRVPDVRESSSQAVLRLAEDGGTVPFIARYRKEATGNLDEVQIRDVLAAKEAWDGLQKRKQHILNQISGQGKLSDLLRQSIETCFDAVELEDLYLPYKQKKKTKAALAREGGLEPLADWIWNCGHGTDQPQPGQTLELWALTYRNESKGLKELQEVLDGALDLLTEKISESKDLRASTRAAYFGEGFLESHAGEKAKRENSKYERYFSFSESVESLLRPENSHRYLALRRGWLEQELKLSLGGGPRGLAIETQLLAEFERFALTVPESPGAELLRKASVTAFRNYVLPSIENEVHKALKEVADRVAVKVFSENVRKVLLSAPFGARPVIGVDPGVRTGSKVACVDASGTYKAYSILMLQDDGAREVSKELLKNLIEANPCDAIAVGNGTGGREAERFLRESVKALGREIPVVVVSESGASVYSASELAREEFPDLDITVRGAVSIARRLQDPLAELVKVDPKSVGVGQYQHDISGSLLRRTLEGVVESCVHQVGVNLNTASEYLLAKVSGIGPALAKGIVQRRSTKGLFNSRQELLEVSHFSSKTFEVAAGFLRIPGATNPLDNTGVHPERYPVLESLAQTMGLGLGDFLGEGVSKLREQSSIASELGEYTFNDVLEELEKPGRDPRETFIPFAFREDLHTLEDLKPGMECPGIVSNVTNFGAFVDIGVHQDGLVHLSQISTKFLRDPTEVLSPGDRVNVRVLSVNLEKKQIALTMRPEKPERAPRRPRAKSPSPEVLRELERRAARAATGTAASAAASVMAKPAPRPASEPRNLNQPSRRQDPEDRQTSRGRSNARPGAGPRKDAGGLFPKRANTRLLSKSPSSPGEGGERPRFRDNSSDRARHQDRPPRPKPKELTHNPFAAALAALKSEESK